MFAFLGLSLLGAVGGLASESPDIAGTWSGADWGTVVLRKAADGHYVGTYLEPFALDPGEIQLRWSRLERRFNGTWRGEAEFGDLSIRLVTNQVRGAFTTDAKSRIDPAT